LSALDAAKSGGQWEDIIQDAKKQSDADADADSVESAQGGGLKKSTFDQLATSSGEARSSKLANLIIVQAIKAAQPTSPGAFREACVRYRVDGVLMLPRRTAKQMQLAPDLALSKIMSSLDIAERRPAAGRRMRVNGQRQDFDCACPCCPPFWREGRSARARQIHLSASIDKLGLDAEPSSNSNSPLTRRTD